VFFCFKECKKISNRVKFTVFDLKQECQKWKAQREKRKSRIPEGKENNNPKDPDRTPTKGVAQTRLSLKKKQVTKKKTAEKTKRTPITRSKVKNQQKVEKVSPVAKVLEDEKKEEVKVSKLKRRSRAKKSKDVNEVKAEVKAGVADEAKQKEEGICETEQKANKKKEDLVKEAEKPSSKKKGADIDVVEVKKAEKEKQKAHASEVSKDAVKPKETKQNDTKKTEIVKKSDVKDVVGKPKTSKNQTKHEGKKENKSKKGVKPVKQNVEVKKIEVKEKAPAKVTKKAEEKKQVCRKNEVKKKAAKKSAEKKQPKKKPVKRKSSAKKPKPKRRKSTVTDYFSAKDEDYKPGESSDSDSDSLLDLSQVKRKIEERRKLSTSNDTPQNGSSKKRKRLDSDSGPQRKKIRWTPGKEDILKRINKKQVYEHFRKEKLPITPQRLLILYEQLSNVLGIKIFDDRPDIEIYSSPDGTFTADGAAIYWLHLARTKGFDVRVEVPEAKSKNVHKRKSLRQAPPKVPDPPKITAKKTLSSKPLKPNSLIKPSTRKSSSTPVRKRKRQSLISEGMQSSPMRVRDLAKERAELKAKKKKIEKAFPFFKDKKNRFTDKPYDPSWEGQKGIFVFHKLEREGGMVRIHCASCKLHEELGENRFFRLYGANSASCVKCGTCGDIF